MRVTRALEKLHTMLKCRGVTLSAAALGTALASETLTAAPATLAASVAASVLASAAAGGGLSVTLLKIMTMTKLKTGILTAVVVTGAATSLVVLQQARAKLREQDDSLQQQSAQLGKVAADNQRLAMLAAHSNGSRDQLADLQRLRAEAQSLRRQTNDLARLREETRRLRQRADVTPKTPLQIKEWRIAKMNFAKNWLLAFHLYAEKNQYQFPTSFAQAASFFEKRDIRAETNLNLDQFEIVYQGSRAMTRPGDVVVLREKEPWQNSDGKWCKIYGLADGSVQMVGMPSRWKNLDGIDTSYDTFEAYEKDHIITPPKQ